MSNKLKFNGLFQGSFWFFYLTILIGFFLRIVWLGDMEYKADEANLFLLAKHYLAGEIPFPWIGLPSSRGIENPPYGSWTILVLGAVFGVETPTLICLGVRLLNCLGFLFLLGIAFRQKEVLLRNSFLWTIALASVNPFAVLWQRKIWIQSLMPFYLPWFLLLWSMRRRSHTFSFVAGVMAAIVCGVHIIGFCFVLSFFLFQFALELRKKEKGFVGWAYIFLGWLAGAMPLVPWFVSALRSWNSLPQGRILSSEILQFKFYRYFFQEPFGLDLSYSLGGGHFQEYLLSMAGIPKLANLLLWIFLIYFSLGLCFSQIMTMWKKGRYSIFTLESEAERWMWAALFGYGIILSVICFSSPIYLHYLLMCYPLSFLFVSFLSLKSLKCATGFLALCWCCQLVTTVCFLSFIHDHQGTKNRDADYGHTFQSQNYLGN